MTELHLRNAKEGERGELEDFLAFNNGEKNRALAKDYIACMFSQDYRRPQFIVAWDRGRGIIGAAAYSEEFFSVDIWGISWVSVHPDFRSQGIGQALVERCLEEIAEAAHNAVTVILATYPGKTGLYKRCGFVESGTDHDGGAVMTRVLQG